jgi:hypothetical protein
MDRKISKTEQIERLIRLSESSRSRLQEEAVALKQRFDVPARVRNSLKGHPTGWMLGSLGAGLVASWVLRRPAPVTEKKHRGLLLSLLGLTVSALQPFAKTWLTEQLKNHLTGRNAPPPGTGFSTGSIP